MMRQSQIAGGKIAKLRHTLQKLKDGEQEHLGVGDAMTPVLTEVLLVDVADAMRELHRYVEMVERKCDDVDSQLSKRWF